MITVPNWVRRQDFNPNGVGLLVNPFYFARRELYRAVRAFAPYLKGRLLDVGCGQKPYQSLFACTEYIGMDVEQSGHPHQAERVDVFYDGRIFPFPSASFDGAVCNQVLEHVFNPDEFLREIHRVLKPDGILLLTVPFVWDEHEQPYDYARYTAFGLRHLLQTHGFEVVEQRKTLSDARVLFQLANLFLYKISRRLRGTRLGSLLATLILNAPVNLIGSLCWRLLPQNADFYLDLALVARKAEGAGTAHVLIKEGHDGTDHG